MTPSTMTDTRFPATTPEPLHVRVAAAQRAANPLLEAARPLLQALADTPNTLDANAASARRRWLEQEVRTFDKVCTMLRLRADHVRHARYCLCAALDEAALQTRWGKGLVAGDDWGSNGVAAALGLDRQGADRVYRIVDDLMRDPLDHLDLLDVIQNILDLGFKGRYRFEADGAHTLARLRARVHDLVLHGEWGNVWPTDASDAAWSLAASHTLTAERGFRSTRPALAVTRWPPLRIDPWVRPTAEIQAHQRSLARKGRWLGIAFCCTAILAASSYLYASHERDARLAAQARAARNVSLVDVLAVDLSQRLRSELAAGTLSLELDRAHATLTLRFADMFSPGEVEVVAWIKPLIAAIGHELAGTSAHARVIGYTDSSPVAAAAVRTNLALSVERARQVMQILVAAGVPAERIEISGKGDADPVAGNQTSEGRTKNRRVEILISE